MPNGVTPAEGQPADTIVTPAAGDGGEKQFEAITSQEALDKIIGQRLAREKNKTAEQYADYDQLKADAAELARIRDGEKTELQKLQEQLAAETAAREKAEQTAAAAAAAQLRIDRATAKETRRHHSRRAGCGDRRTAATGGGCAGPATKPPTGSALAGPRRLDLGRP